MTIKILRENDVSYPKLKIFLLPSLHCNKSFQKFLKNWLIQDTAKIWTNKNVDEEGERYVDRVATRWRFRNLKTITQDEAVAYSNVISFA